MVSRFLQGLSGFWGPDGPELMIQVRRRSGLTWEVAKGKLEPGESPWQAAIREVQEEIGCTMICPFRPIWARFAMVFALLNVFRV